MRRFWFKLVVFLGPFVALYSVPFLTMALSREILPVGRLARAHASASDVNVVYGPAYTNPDKRYKLLSLQLHDAPVLAVGTSRVMQLRSAFFAGGERSFYNAGGLVSRIWHMRRVLPLISRSASTHYLILGLDQWSYNDHWAWASDDPGVEGEWSAESDALANLRFGLHAWPDLLTGKIRLWPLATSTKGFGVNARMKGNGFRRDGSYVYADLIRDPKVGADYEFRDTLDRIHGRKLRYEAGAVVSQSALDETRRLVEACRAHGFELLVFLPPFAPTIVDALRASGHHRYLDDVPARVREIVEAEGVPFFDFTSCAEQRCTDAEFIDGSHGGDALFGRLLLEMSSRVPWLEERLEPGLPARAERSRGHKTMD